MVDQDPSIREKKRLRPCRVNVRLTQEEYGHLREQSEIVNRRPASVMRKLALNMRLKPVARFPEDVYRALTSFGRNLNQLAHQANLGRVDKDEVETLREEVSRLMNLLLAKQHP